jgi:hypothetical protein
MNLMKRPVSEILNDPVAKLQLSGWTMFWCGFLFAVINVVSGPFTVRGLFHAISDSAVMLVFGAWMLGTAQSMQRIAALAKENAALRGQTQTA